MHSTYALQSVTVTLPARLDEPILYSPSWHGIACRSLLAAVSVNAAAGAIAAAAATNAAAGAMVCWTHCLTAWVVCRP